MNGADYELFGLWWHRAYNEKVFRFSFFSRVFPIFLPQFERICGKIRWRKPKTRWYRINFFPLPFPLFHAIPPSPLGPKSAISFQINRITIFRNNRLSSKNVKTFKQFDQSSFAKLCFVGKPEEYEETNRHRSA